MLLISRSAPSRAAPSTYPFGARTALVVGERLLRIASTCYTGAHYKRDARQMYLLAGPTSARAPGVAAFAEICKQLLLGTGFTVAYWHAFCLPTVWTLEGWY
jgi:hypothetical protein